MIDREKPVFQKRVKFRSEPLNHPTIRGDESE
jgi:hypothetical protein